MMKHFCLIFLLVISHQFSFAQVSASQLIDKGIALHDKKEYEAAIAMYDMALSADPDNYKAMYEKTYTLIEIKRYKESIDILKKILKGSKNGELRKLCYVQYGTALDYNGDAANAISQYDAGIREFPDYYSLYFNKGITLYSLDKKEEAAACFKRSLLLKPFHGSSHFYLAQSMQTNRIAQVLSLYTFLLIEPEGDRAKRAVTQLEELFVIGVGKSDGKKSTINIEESASANKNKGKEDDFSSADLMLSLLGANSDLFNPQGVKTQADQLSYKMQILINILDESYGKADNGFFRNFYLPMFFEMKKKGYVSTASYIVLLSKEDKVNNEWIDKNEDKTKEFYDWLGKFEWSKKADIN